MRKTDKPETNKSRRQFLKTSVLGGIAAVSLPTLSFAEKAAAPFSKVQIKSSEFDEITVGELSAGLKSGKYTVRSIAEHYIERIKEMDKSGPSINSVIELNPDALSIADSLDKELK